MTQRHISFIVIAIIFILGMLPVLSMLFSTFYTQGHFSLSGYKNLFHNSILWKSFFNSFSLASFVAFFTTFIGTILGVLFTKTNLPFRNFWILLLFIPLLIPPYIVAFGWSELLTNDTLRELFFGFWGTAFVLFCIYLPIPMLMSAIFIRQINPHLEEAGLLLCDWKCVVTKITLRSIQKAIVLSFLLVFILSFGESSVANFLHFDILPLQSFVQFAAFYDFKTATISAMPLIFIAIIVLVIEYQLITKKDLYFKTYSKTLTIDLKHYTNPLLLVVILMVLIIFILPLLALIQNIDIQSFFIAIKKASVPLLRSFIYAGLGATLLAFFGFLSAYIITYKTTRLYSIFNGSIIFLFILSSTVIGISLILFWNRPYTNFIYGTAVIILIGYLVKYLLLSTKIIEIKLRQISPSLLDSAKLSGASWLQILWFILLPLSSESIIVAWFIGFIFSLRESTITMLVSPAGSATLPIYILTQMANGKDAIIASLCLIMILSVLLPLILFLGYKRRA